MVDVVPLYIRKDIILTTDLLTEDKRTRETKILLMLLNAHVVNCVLLRARYDQVISKDLK